MIGTSIHTWFFYMSESPMEKLSQATTHFDEQEGVKCSQRSETRFSVLTDDSDMSISVGPLRSLPYDKDVITFSISCERFMRESGERALRNYIKNICGVYKTTSPNYMCGIHTGNIDVIGDYIPAPVSDYSLAQNRIIYPTWLMGFSPAMVEEYGREWLLDLPAERIKELSDGGIMTVATEDITECEREDELHEIILEAVDDLAEAFGADQLDGP